MTQASWAPASSRAADGVGHHLAGGVVDVGLQEDHGLARRPAFDRIPQHDLGDVGAVVQLAGAGPEATRSHDHRRQVAPAHDGGGQEGGPRGRGRLERNVDAVAGRPLEQLDHGRGGRGQEAVGRPVHPGARGHRAGEDLLDAEDVQGGAGPDDVDDGVEAAHLVEVDLARRAAMELALGLGQAVEGGQGQLLDPVRQAGLHDQAGDVRRRAHDRRLLGMDVDLGGGDATAQHGLGLDRPAAHGQELADVSDLVEVRSGVDEGAEGHVARNAGEAVEPGDRHRRAPTPRRRTTAHAAP